MKNIKNFLIVILLVIVLVLGYLQFKTRETNSISNLNQTSSSTENEISSTIYKFNNLLIRYDSNKWIPIDDRYCFPSEGENGIKYNGTPCDLIGFTFKYLDPGATSDDVITVGGWQPMACDVILKKTKCSDAYSMVTSSNNKEVLSFYDYLINLMP